MAQVSAIVSFFVLLFTVMLISVRSVRDLREKRYYNVRYYIPMFADRVYNLNNPCDASSYFDLPFCPPGNPIKKKSLEEVLEGADCFTNTQYELKFKVEKIRETLCERNLTKYEVAKFRDAIKNKSQFHMFYNNIRLWDLVGKIVEDPRTFNHSRYYLFKHINLDVYYIEDQVKQIYLTSDFDSAVDITKDVGKRFNFTYSVFWHKQEVTSEDPVFNNETSKEKNDWPTEQQGEWGFLLSFLFGASIIMIWLALILTVTVPYLANHFTRYSRRQKSRRNIHGKACRCPPYSSLLGAILGIGNQLLVLICTLFVLAHKGVLYPCNYERLWTYFLLIYSLTCVVSGYKAASFHSGYTTVGWKECVFQTGVFYLVPASITFLFASVVGQITLGLSDLPGFDPIGTGTILFTWGVGTFSCLGVGGMFGFYFRPKRQPPCATRRIPKVSSRLSWYMEPPAQMFLGGLIPFLIIFGEMDNIYASLWSHKVCGAFSTLLRDFVVVIITTIVVGMSFTYVQLSQQDRQWSWRSVFRGGSTAIFMFTYGIYFHVRANVSDNSMLLLLFMGYNACIFYAFFLVLGTIGFYSSLFVFRLKYRGSLEGRVK